MFLNLMSTLFKNSLNALYRAAASRTWLARNMMLYKELVHFFKKLPDTNSSFLDKISSRMVKTNHMKLKKKNCPAYYLLFITSVEFFEIRRKNASFWKFAREYWQNGYIRARIIWKEIFENSRANMVIFPYLRANFFVLKQFQKINQKSYKAVPRALMII